MQVKKSKKADLEHKRILFLEIGLVLVLGIVFSAFKWGTPAINTSNLGNLNLNAGFEDEILNTFQEEEIQEPEPEPEEKKETVIETLTVIDDKEKESDINFTSEAGENTKIKIDMKAFTEIPVEKTEPIPFSKVEEKPAFPGGDAALLGYLAENTKYPEIPKTNGIEGRVFVQFVIDESGNVSNVTIARGVDLYLDKEAKRVVSTLPKWIPGKQRGIPVPVTYIVPINFKLY